ncbi:MAG: DUF2185 domain-containing protein [Roseburia sp.]|nr:DUF2185 domain-containing protein [Roseburia sp.]MCM1099686.1 DUF2185 domain-containing protein [Ruminococcus flavefaciens]
MNRILCEIKELIDSNIKLYLPQVTDGELENGGEVYYMNGKNGTEFDWYVNGNLSPFMVFYNDEANLGAVKLLLSKDGRVVLYLYGDRGNQLVKQAETQMDASEEELLELAVILRNEADDRRIWGKCIDGINTDIVVSEEMRSEFQGREKNYEVMKNRKRILSQSACVSKRITREGWKVGYMERLEPRGEGDSGWCFFAGNESDKYTSDVRNIELLYVGDVWQHFDSDILRYIDAPAGTRLVRISADAFEIDQNDKPVFLVKR